MKELRITIVDNSGLTFVGYADIYGEGNIITIEKARCVILWGAKNHLAELTTGPKAETKLGAMADVEVFRDKFIASYKVSDEWKSVLS